LKEAIKHAGAVAVTGGFVSHAALEELEKDLEAEKHNV